MSACHSRISRATVLSVLERRRQLAVVDVEDPGLDPEDARALGDFRLAPPRQRTAGLLEVADVAVGHRHELHFVPGAAHSAATPLAFSSASSGCAPNAIMRERRVGWLDCTDGCATATAISRKDSGE